MPKMTGKFKKGTNKGRSWEIYADPGSSSGYTRKNWDPYDTSNEGRPTEYFEPYNMAAAEADEQNRMERAARRAAAQAAEDAQDRDFFLRGQRAKERAFQEGVRQYNEGMGLKREQLGFQREDAAADRKLRAQDLKLRELDTRTRIQIGLKELELKERNMGNEDQRARERNVMDYLGAIGKLRLPYAELQALSQRAVQGIIPGAAAAGAAAGGGALTADQWQALAQGVNRNWEVSQIGQGSPLAG